MSSHQPNSDNNQTQNSPSTDNSTDIAVLDALKRTLHQAEKKRTLEEQVAYLKSQGIDPAKSYRTWDDEEEGD